MTTHTHTPSPIPLLPSLHTLPIREAQLAIKIKTMIAIAQNRPNTRILFVVNRIDQVLKLFAQYNLAPITLDDNQIHFSNRSCITLRLSNAIPKIKTRYNEVIVDDCFNQLIKNSALKLLAPNKGLVNGERA